MSVITSLDLPPAGRPQEGNLILVVDDEPAFGEIVKALIAGTGYTVDTAPDAPAAFHAVRLRQYALILMDIEMAGITGLRGAARIRQTADWTKQVPMIAFTSHRPPRGERFFLERDFDGWLPKPFTATDLLTLMKRWLPVETVIERPDIQEGLQQVMGRQEMDAMMARLRHNFAQAVAAIDAGADPAPYGHRLGGLAGTMGLPGLGRAWLALSAGSKPKIWDTVRHITLDWMGMTT